MTHKKLTIVTSFNRPCGISQYVEHLIEALEEIDTIKIEIAEIPVDLFRSNSKTAREKSKKELNEICTKCKKSDFTNIQFEHGLYGTSPFSIIRRLKKIIESSQKIIITHHTCIDNHSNYLIPSYKSISNWLRDFRRNYVIFKMLKYCKKKDCYHIVHTQRDKNNLTYLANIDEINIIDYPLTFLKTSKKNKYSLINKKSEKSKILGSPLANKKIIGVFGFLHYAKGIETAISAMTHLPDEYHLIIVGGLHPESICKFKISQPYITKLISTVEDKKISDRVHFIGTMSNEKFNIIMSLCDVITLPYAEVGQSSSGPVSIALDLGLPIICSNNECFKELSRYATEAITFFEISNHLELARKIDLIIKNTINTKNAIDTYREKYNVENRAEIYQKLTER